MLVAEKRSNEHVADPEAKRKYWRGGDDGGLG